MAGNGVKLSIGRVRITSAVGPGEARYIEYIRSQSAMIAENMRKVAEYLNASTAEAMIYGLEPVYKESQRLVPVDTGRLKKSGFLEIQKGVNGHIAAIGYARYGQPHYAGIVHERLDFRHRAPTQAKYLETAWSTKQDTFKRRLTLYMQKKMKEAEGAGG